MTDAENTVTDGLEKKDERTANEQNIEVLEGNLKLVLENMSVIDTDYAFIKSLKYKALIHKREDVPGEAKYWFSPCLMNKLESFSVDINRSIEVMQECINQLINCSGEEYHNRMILPPKNNPNYAVAKKQFDANLKLNLVEGSDWVRTFNHHIELCGVLMGSFILNMCKVITRLRIINGEDFPADPYESIKDLPHKLLLDSRLTCSYFIDGFNSASDEI